MTGSRSLALVGAVTLLLAIAAAAHSLDRLPEGLVATYYSDANWSSTPVRTTIDAQPSLDSLVAAWGGNVPETFSAAWTGSLVVLRTAVFTFATSSEDGSAVYIDGHLVVDNGGRHAVRFASGSTHLDRGVHEIFVEYFKAGDTLQFELLTGRAGGPLGPIAPWTLFPHRAKLPRLMASVALRLAFRGLVWLWLATLAALLWARLVRAAGRWLSVLRTDRTAAALAAVLVGSVLLDAAGLWWGVPSFWAGDEIVPKTVLIGLSQHFNGGWFDRYPPFQYYVLTALFSPWLLLQSLGLIHQPERLREAAFLVLSRCFSVAAAVGTLVAVYKCGDEAFGRRAGLFASAMLALLTPFVYYAKVANPEVPYLLWVAVSLLFFVRFMRTAAVRDVLLFSAAAVLATCTKDQAFALYIVAPFAIVYRVWAADRERGVAHPLRHAVLSPEIGIAAATAIGVFSACYLLPFNTAGLVRHVRDIVGPGSQGYRMVEPTVAGRLSLLRLSAHLDQCAWGWPLCVASAAGFVVAARERASRRATLWLALVAASYYIGFIDVVLYNYDRYLLPICVVQALFGGVAVDRLLRPPDSARRTWRIAIVGTAFGYSLLYASTVDVLMIRDSRYTAERWLRDHAGRDHLVGTVFPLVVLPRMGDVESVDIGTIEDLRRWGPSYFVVNADYARAVPEDLPVGHLVSGLQHETLGYRLAFRYRSPAPWRWLPGADPDLVGPRLEGASFSFLRDINPTIEIYERVGGQ